MPAFSERLEKQRLIVPVANQFTSIYGKLYEWRGFREDIPVSRAVLVAEFAPYFSQCGVISGEFHVQALAPER